MRNWPIYLGAAAVVVGLILLLLLGPTLVAQLQGHCDYRDCFSALDGALLVSGGILFLGGMSLAISVAIRRAR
jgi:hypothetical protein